MPADFPTCRASERAMIRSTAKLTALAAIAAAALTLTFPPAARAQIQVSKEVRPAVAFTVYEHKKHGSCGVLDCLDKTGPDLGLRDMLDGLVTVGFAPFTGTDTSAATAARATVLFRTEEIPPHFTNATLVLTAKLAI